MSFVDWESWARDTGRLAQEFASGFERVHGFEPGEHEVVRSSDAEGVAAVAALKAAGVDGDLFAFYAAVGSVTLPDFRSGIWIDDAESVVGGVAAGNYPTQVTGALEDSVTVFATDGGGAMFAISQVAGCVYRLSLGALVGTTLEVDPAGWSLVAGSLREFMERLRSDLKAEVDSLQR